MHTLVCKKRPKAAEGLLGQTSWCEGGRGGGRRAGGRDPGRYGQETPRPAQQRPLLEVWEHAIWAGWIRTNPARARRPSSNQMHDCPLLDKMLFSFAGQPAKGKHWLYGPPGGFRQDLLSFSFHIYTMGVVGNNIGPCKGLLSGGNEVLLCSTPACRSALCSDKIQVTFLR